MRLGDNESVCLNLFTPIRLGEPSLFITSSKANLLLPWFLDVLAVKAIFKWMFGFIFTYKSLTDTFSLCLLLVALCLTLCLCKCSHTFLLLLWPFSCGLFLKFSLFLSLSPSLIPPHALCLSWHSSETKLWIDGDKTVSSVLQCQAATRAALGSPDSVVMDEWIHGVRRCQIKKTLFCPVNFYELLVQISLLGS